MDPMDRNEVAQMAAKAANLAVTGHEEAKHQPAPQAILEHAEVEAPVAPPPAGFLQDGQGNGSSKRLESILGFGAAVLVAVLGIIFAPGHLLEVAGVTGAFLTYSATMQGISASSERGMP